ncbi:hypothetical protein C8Q72DRAFT_834655 [Fomitopsis betulina]|nr:hypothetical protein C8Q72DRAFT_834655 [Fomitopsis betulina]
MDVDVRRMREESLELALGELHRVRRLHIHATHGLSPKVLQLLVGPAPLLQELYLDGVLVDTEVPAYFLDMACGETSPLPRCLRLYDVHLGISPSTAPCSMLRKLDLIFSSDEHFSPRLVDIVDVLGMLPSLEALNIEQGIDSQVWLAEDAERVHSITLPSIRTLGLSAWACECAYILRNLDLPSLIFMEVTASNSSSDDIELLAPVLHHKISGLGTMHKLRITGINDTDIDSYRGPLRFYGSTGWPDEPRLASSHHDIFTIELQNCESHSECLSAICYDALPCADVLSATVQGWNVNADSWCAMLQTMVNMQVLTVKNVCNPSYLFLGLCMEDTRESARADLRYPSPGLKELSMYNVCLDRDVVGEWCHVQSFGAKEIPATLIEGLIWALRYRQEEGCAVLSMLRLQDCQGLQSCTGPWDTWPFWSTTGDFSLGRPRE